MRNRILTVLIILTLGFIWVHSCMGRESSAEESAKVTEIVEPVLEIVVGEGNVTDHLVRKLAHFSEFALLGFELALRLAGKRKGWLHACAAGFFVGFLDETIQIFAFRGDAIIDVWLDFSGVVFGALAALLAQWLFRKLWKRRKASADA